MDGESLMDRISELCRSMGIVDLGVADPEAWDSDQLVSSRISQECRPLSIMPDARSVIVIGIPIQQTVLDTAPSIAYRHLYSTVNTMLDQCAQRIAMELISEGFRAVAIPRDGYHGISGLMERPDAFFSHRHSAYLAGLGSFGQNNVILTRRYGPRIRFTSVITSAELPAGNPSGEDLCIGCGLCMEACPSKAIPDSPYPLGITDKPACVAESARLAAMSISPCGRCISVCPVGKESGPSPTDEAIRRIREYVKR